MGPGVPSPAPDSLLLFPERTEMDSKDRGQEIVCVSVCSAGRSHQWDWDSPDRGDGPGVLQRLTTPASPGGWFDHAAFWAMLQLTFVTCPEVGL